MSAHQKLAGRWCVVGAALMVAILPFLLRAATPVASPATRFWTIDLFVDSGAKPLGAYQLTFAALEQGARIVGIEGGEHRAFEDAPYYDPAAMQHERAILAAFNTGPAATLPKGRIRIATIHVQSDGTRRPDFAVEMQTAANHEATPIRAQASWQYRTSP